MEKIGENELYIYDDFSKKKIYFRIDSNQCYLNDISNVADELDNEDLNDEIVPPQIEVEDDEIEDDDLVDEYNEDDDRYDREMDDDKVDYRRDYFNDFGDDGEVNDDY